MHSVPAFSSCGRGGADSRKPSESDAGLDSSFLSKQTAEEDWDDANVPYPMRQQHPSRQVPEPAFRDVWKGPAE
eukprot:2909977-Rhodomonas_salina.3